MKEIGLEKFENEGKGEGQFIKVFRAVFREMILLTLINGARGDR